MTPVWRRQSGFSLLEALIATAITVTVTAAVFTVVGSSQGIADTQPEFADMQQRLRVGVDVLRHDLLMAGAGAYAGAASGSLVGVVRAHSAVPPRRVSGLRRWSGRLPRERRHDRVRAGDRVADDAPIAADRPVEGRHQLGSGVSDGRRGVRLQARRGRGSSTTARARSTCLA